MDLYFRKLKRKDIPQILEISKEIWEGEDYIPNVIETWLEGDDSYNYGAFLDIEMNHLVGFGRVKILSKNLVWLEGGRVKKSQQKKGIGEKLMRHALNYAKDYGATRAQYDTSSENYGSIALADKLGFTKKFRMELFYVRKEEIIFPKSVNLQDIKILTPEQALNVYKNIENGPDDEICIGWSYIPQKLKFLKNQKGKFISNLEAIIHDKSSPIRNEENESEIDIGWMILYGKPTYAKEILQYTLNQYHEDSRFDSYYLFCHPALVFIAKEVGFHREEEGPKGVILFEKIL
jgi:ribosomal protein S18 acetylase RimI-like enzyme